MPPNRALALGQSRRPRPASSKTTKCRAPSASSHMVRKNFFEKIGVGRKSHVMQVSERSARDTRDMPRLSEPLRYDRQEEMRREEQRKSHRQQSPSSVASDIPLCGLQINEKQVCFQESVTVVLIPKSFEYSSRVQARLFHDSIQYSEDIGRNLVEFQAENLDWFNVCVEDDMHVCEKTGELIHPVHMQQNNQHAFGSSKTSYQPCCFSQDSCSQDSVSEERSRYWSDQNAI